MPPKRRGGRGGGGGGGKGKGAEKKAARRAAQAAQAAADAEVRGIIEAAEAQGAALLRNVAAPLLQIDVPVAKPPPACGCACDEAAAEAPEGSAADEPPRRVVVECFGAPLQKTLQKTKKPAAAAAAASASASASASAGEEGAAGTVRPLPQSLLSFCFDLTETNMRPVYEETWGWNASKKMRELTDDKARFLIAFEEGADWDGAASTTADVSSAGDEGAETAALPGKPVAFIHLQFVSEDPGEATAAARSGNIAAAKAAAAGPRRDRVVVYCMEVQVSAGYRGGGLGRRLMMLMDLVGGQHGADTSMLTVLKPNTDAVRFYTQRLNYTEDPISPGSVDPENASRYFYSILSKPLKRK